MNSRTRASLSSLAFAGLVVAMTAGGALGQWSENFDDYDTGSTLNGQGDWTGWDLSAVDADVVDDVAASDPNSLRLRSDSDMVMQFQGFAGGRWVVSAMTFISATHSGETWFILMDQYTAGGDPKHWATQIGMGNGWVTSAGGSDFGGSGSLPWITDEWVELRIEIDMDANFQRITYGGQFLDETPWTTAGINEIQAIDLWSNVGLEGYFDDLSVTPVPTGPRALRAATITGACPDPDPVQVKIVQALAAGADPAEQVTVTETVTGEFGAAQVTAANGGTVTDLLPTRTITPRGFISAWLLLGPFIQPVPVAGQAYDNPGCPQMQLDYLTDGDTLEVDIFPEAGQTIATDFGGVAASLGLRGTLDLNPGGVPTWNAHFNKDDTIDFNNEHYFADIDQVMMYAFAYVWAENDVDVDLCTDSDDSIQVIIDGGEAWCNSLPRGMQGSGTCVDTVPYGTLSAGEHTVMVKVFEGGGGHGFRFAFKAAGTSDPAPGLSVCLTPDTKPCVFKPIGASISWEVTRQQLVDGVGYALDLDSGRASFKGDVEGLRITGDAAVSVCPFATNLLGQIMDANWLVVGPFANANNGCLDATGAGMLRNHIAPSTIECLYPVAGDEVPFDPADPDQASTGYLGPLGPSDYPVVQQFDDGSQNGDLDLDAHTGPADDDGMMSWLITYVEYTGAPGQVGICLGSDDSAQVWFNDQMIVNDAACRGRGDCDQSVTVDVVPGAYRIAFGVWENNGGWGGRLSLRDAASQAPILDGTSPDWKFWGTVRPPAERFAGGFIPCTAPPKPKFKRGDSNADGDMNITDGIFVLNYLFLGGSNPPCTESAEANDDGELNITDGIYILNFLFLGGAEPPAPGNEACGEDPAGSVDLGCESYPGC